MRGIHRARRLPAMPIPYASLDCLEPVPIASLDRSERGRSLGNLAGLQLLLVPVLGACSLAAGFQALGFLMLASQAPNLLALLLLRRGRWVDASGALSLLSFLGIGAFAACAGGPLATAALPWLLLGPMLAGHAFGARGVVVAGALVGSLLLGLSVQHWLGPDLTNAAATPGLTPAVLLSATGALVILVATLASQHRATRRVESARREAEAGFRAALDGLPDAMIVLRPTSGRRSGFEEIFRNRAAAEVLAAFEQHDGGLLELRAGPRAPTLRLDLARLAMEGGRLEQQGLSHSGVPAVYDLCGVRWGRAVLVALRDRSERLRLEQALAVARAGAAGSGSARGEYLARVSHEIRTPLSGIHGLAQLLLEGAPEVAAEACLGTILSCSGSLLRLLDDSLDLVDLERGSLELQRGRFDLQELLDELAESLAPRAAELGLEWNVARRGDVLRWIHGDRSRLYQVLDALADNALRYTRSGEVAVEIRPGPERGGRPCTRFVVRDTGIGIAPERLPVLFQPLPAVPAPRVPGGSGLGLGLWIARELVTKMGGHLEIASKVDEGTTFSFELALEAAVPPPGAPPQHEGLAGQRVLVVAPADTTADTLCCYLRELGCRYRRVGAADEAATLIQAAAAEDDPFDVLVAGAEPLGAEALRDVLRDSGQRRLRVVVLRRIGECPPSEQAAAASLTLPPRLGPLRRTLLAVCGLDERLSAAAGVEPAAVHAPGEGRILVAEDQEVNRQLLRRMLAREGLVAETVPDGLAAVRMAAEGSFDLILMNCAVPELDAFEATRRIRALEGARGRVPIVGVTAQDLEGARERCLQAGMDDCLAQPIDFGAFRATLHRFLTGARVGPERERAPR